MFPLRHFCIVLALLVIAAHAQAQTASVLQPGDWIRVRPHVGERTAGALVEIDEQKLRIEASQGSSMEYALSDIARIELSLGRDRMRGAEVGGMIGAIGGLAVGGLITLLDIPGGGGANLAIIGVPIYTTPAGIVLGALIPPRRFVDVSGSVLGGERSRRGRRGAVPRP